MDYEQKCKEYLERAKEQLNGAKVFDYDNEQIAHAIRTTVYSIFPGLKESEDERIRKTLINFFDGWGDKIWDSGIKYSEVVAWIQKQGKHANFRNKIQIGDKVTRNDNGELVNLSQLERVAKKLEKQEEQKFFDYENATIIQKDFAPKVEPKFHEGEWVVFNNKHQSIYQVEKIEDGYYILRHTHGGTFRVCVLHDESLRLWSVEDAKDGDVLEFGDHGRLVVGIVSYVNKTTGKVDVNCLLENNNFKVGNYYNLDTIKPHPATKEQRELLFQKIKESGYERDSEKKELKEIEHDVQLTEFEEAVKDLMNDYRDAIGDNDATIEEVKEHAAYMLSLIHQNFAWSEEDEEKFRDVIRLIEQGAPVQSMRVHYNNWLRTLKDRVQPQPKQEWSEEDEYNFAFIQEALLGLDGDDSYREKCCKMAEWLESIKEKFVDFDKGFNVGFSAAKHNQWKPSEHQMASITCAVRKMKESACYDSELVSLYQDLKKLKG